MALAEDMLAAIKERRRAIKDDAPCEGCGATLADCKANQGKDPTAPAWFGCCARGLEMAPCAHRPDPAAMDALLEEIKSRHVRTLDEVLLDSVSPFGRNHRWLPAVCMLDNCGCSGEAHP